MDARAYERANPINPQLLFTELSKRLPDGAIVTADSGSAANWYARDIQLRDGMRGSLSGNLASMGAGVPYAIAAKFAYSDRPVFALMGDGAMQMNGLAELLTVAKYRERWADQRFYVLVLHNNDLNQVTWEQRVLQGNPKYDASQDLPDFDYAAFATSIGLRGIRVEAPEQVGPAWHEALASDRPVVIDALCDPDVPPLPPTSRSRRRRRSRSRSARVTPTRSASPCSRSSRRSTRSCRIARDATPEHAIDGMCDVDHISV